MTDETHPLEAFGYTTEGEGSTASGAWANAPTVVLVWKDQVITAELFAAGSGSRAWDAESEALWAALKRTGGGFSLQDKGINVNYSQARFREIDRVQFTPCEADKRGSIRFTKRANTEGNKKWYERVASQAGHLLDQLATPQVEFTADQQTVFQEIQRVVSQGTTTTCPNCGQRVQEDAAFCPNCGHNLSQERVARGYQCKNCGASLEAGTKFCPQCGTKVEAAG